MTAARRNLAAIAEAELDELELRRRRVALALMLTAEVLCAIAGVAAFLALTRHELGWSALLALSSASSYLTADLIERA